MNHDMQHCDGVIKKEGDNILCSRKEFCERYRAYHEAKEIGLTVPYGEAKICMSNQHYNFVHRSDSEKASGDEFWNKIHSLRARDDISYLYVLDQVREHAFVLEAEALQSKIKILKLEEELLIEKARNCSTKSTYKPTPGLGIGCC